jgi:uncharacterized OsmC-like protein
MKVSAKLTNSFQQHTIQVETNGDMKTIQVAPKPSGYGSAANGAEMLLAALATCYCNDIYREAAHRNIDVTQVEVVFSCEFGGVGDPGAQFEYKANIVSSASENEINELLRHTDEVAEVHNTLRKGVPVKLVNW